jgi:hypothetical protein
MRTHIHCSRSDSNVAHLAERAPKAGYVVKAVVKHATHIYSSRSHSNVAHLAERASKAGDVVKTVVQHAS